RVGEYHEIAAVTSILHEAQKVFECQTTRGGYVLDMPPEEHRCRRIIENNDLVERQREIVLDAPADLLMAQSIGAVEPLDCQNGFHLKGTPAPAAALLSG